MIYKVKVIDEITTHTVIEAEVTTSGLRVMLEKFTCMKNEQRAIFMDKAYEGGKQIYNGARHDRNNRYTVKVKRNRTPEEKLLQAIFQTPEGA